MTMTTVFEMRPEVLDGALDLEGGEAAFSIISEFERIVKAAAKLGFVVVDFTYDDPPIFTFAKADGSDFSLEEDLALARAVYDDPDFEY